jgi:hypothetical protein
MSSRNGDRARFQKNRRRKMLLRQRIQALLKAFHSPVTAAVTAVDAQSGKP